MTPEQRWQRVQEMFEAALQRDPAEREPYLQQACAGDPLLYTEVAELLAHDEQAMRDQFLAAPVSVSRTENVAPLTTPVRLSVCFHAGPRQAEGGLGEIYLAEDDQFHRKVALKRIQAHHARNPDSRRRFLNEAAVTAKLEHPGVVPVHGLAFSEDGLPCYVMRFIHGQTLKQAIRRFYEADKPGRDLGERNLEFRQLLNRLIAVCNTVAYAHSRGILHRDLKPDNIMLGEFGETVVVDWGLAKEVAGATEAEPCRAEAPPDSRKEGDGTEIGRGIGTPAYMSPEQAAGQWNVVGPRSDVYSLGATLYVHLTGEAPPPAGSTREPQSMKGTVPPALQAICRKAMALQPEDRYATALELAADLEHWLADEPVQAYREPLRGRLRRWTRRHRLVVTGVAAAVGVAVLALGLSTGLLTAAYQRERAAKQSATAAYERERAAKQLASEHEQQAKANLKLGREAVDKFFLKVSASPHLKATGAEQFRRALLRDARDYVERFVQIQGDDADLQAERARAYILLASLTSEIESQTEAIHLGRQALDILAPLAHDHPNVPEYQHLQAGALRLLGHLYANTNQFEPAKDAYAKALSIYQELGLAHADVPDHRDGQAKALHDLGTLHRLRTHWHPMEAQKFYQQALPIREELARTHPQVVEYQDGLATALNALGNLYASALGQPTRRAEAFYEQALPIRERLAHDHPSDADYQERLASTLSALGYVYRVNGKPDQAKESFERALSIRQQIVRIHPDVQSYQDGLVRTLHDLGLFYYNRGQIRQARERLEEALPLAEKLAQRAEVPSRQGTLSQLRLFHAMTLARSGEHSQAAQVADSEVRKPSVSGIELRNAGGVYSLCSAAARTDATILPGDRDQVADKYVARAVESLERAYQSGQFKSQRQLDELKQLQELAPIRSSPRFLQFLHEASKAIALPPQPKPAQ
jgi:serine/threonine-protein kinase